MALIGVDWGSSSLRIYQFDGLGKVEIERSSPLGVKRIENSNFEATLFELMADFICAGDVVVLTGMITSRNGWLETDYIQTPCTLHDYVKSCKTLNVRGIKCVFLPGVCQLEPADVMRGEELQLFGLDLTQSNSICILPGTHSKWAWLNEQRIIGFKTCPTGELYELLMHNSLIGNLFKENSFDQKAFSDGVSEGMQKDMELGGIFGRLFSIRAKILLGQLAPEEAGSFLSGLLIGNEISVFDSVLKNADSLHIIGNENLTQRYGLACETVGYKTLRHNTSSIQGLWRVSKKLRENNVI